MAGAPFWLYAGGVVPCPEPRGLKAQRLVFRQVPTPRLPSLPLGAAVGSHTERPTIMREHCLDPSPVRADGALRPTDVRMPVAATNSPLRGGLPKQNQKAVHEHVPSPLRSIRAKCLDCSGGNRAEVRLCTVHRCALHPFRMGRNPNRRRAAQ